MTQRVARGYEPDAQVNGKPGALVVIRVTVEGRCVTTQDVFRLSVRQVLALRCRHADETRGSGVYPFTSNSIRLN